MEATVSSLFTEDAVETSSIDSTVRKSVKMLVLILGDVNPKKLCILLIVVPILD